MSSFDPRDFHDLADLAGIAQRQEMLKQMRQQQGSQIRKSEGPLPKNRQCPSCGGRLAGEFPKCQNCGSGIAWADGLPCVPGKENELREKIGRQRVYDLIWQFNDRSLPPEQIAEQLVAVHPRELEALTRDGIRFDATGVRAWMESERGKRFCRDCGRSILPKSPNGRCGGCNAKLNPRGCLVIAIALLITAVSLSFKSTTVTEKNMARELLVIHDDGLVAKCAAKASTSESLVVKDRPEQMIALNYHKVVRP